MLKVKHHGSQSKQTSYIIGFTVYNDYQHVCMCLSHIIKITYLLTNFTPGMVRYSRV